MYKFPITGPPHSGKSTLMKALRYPYPDAQFIPEPAEYIIKAEKAHAEADPTYEPILPLTEPAMFARYAVKMSGILESEISPEKLTFLDRCLADNVGYLAMRGIRDMSLNLSEKIAEANYTLAFFCEPVGTYKTSIIREESAEQAARTQEFLRRAYEESGIPIVDLPAFPELNKHEGIEMRIAIIGQTLAELDIAA